MGRRLVNVGVLDLLRRSGSGPRYEYRVTPDGYHALATRILVEIAEVDRTSPAGLDALARIRERLDRIVDRRVYLRLSPEPFETIAANLPGMTTI